MSPAIGQFRDILIDYYPAPVLHLNSDLEIEYANQFAKNAFCTCSESCDCPDIICSCSEGSNLLNVLPSVTDNELFESWLDSGGDSLFYLEDVLKDHVYHFTCRKIPGGCINIYGSDITEARRISQEKEDIERIVKHDLRNPLNGILGIAELLQDEEDPAEKAGFIEDIRKSCHDMLYLLDNSMEIARMEEGSYELHLVPFDLIEMLRKLQADWQKILDSKKMEIAVFMDGEKITPESRLDIKGEVHHIRNMVANLVLNAIEAAPPEGQVSLNISVPDGNAVIEIHNEGAIPENIRSRFFEKYVTSGKKKGTGLGTYSARLIARAHGGQMDFTSSLSEGTTLRVTLPL